MLERFMRANVSRWQSVYERFPSPARSALVSARGLFLSQMRYAPETFSMLKILRAHERWSAEEIVAHQMNALRETIGGARRNVPHYANYAREEIRTFADLRRLPVLERETVRQNHEQFLRRGTPARKRIRAGTTGTTGGNLRVAFTEELARANWACLLRQWAWAGVEAQRAAGDAIWRASGAGGMHRAALLGLQLAGAADSDEHFSSGGENRAAISGVSAQAGGENIWRDFRRCWEFWPILLREQRETFPMRTIFTSGEPLYPAARAKIEAAFQCKVFDSYGMTEYCG